MEIKHNFALQSLNSFGMTAVARYFASCSSADELIEALDHRGEERLLVLGGGSNILLTGDVDGFVVKNDIGGIEVLHEDPHHVYIRAGAGVNWHQFVLFCVDRNLGGVENLSLIPGSCGASPMQNIGAYGVELRDTFHELEALHIESRKSSVFSNLDCAFGYRESVFKNKFRDQFIIHNVTFRLNKVPILNTSYGAIAQELERMRKEPSVKNISDAVINIRSSKLPDPKKIGNAGSFFKNPVVAEDIFEKLRSSFAGIPAYPQEDGSVKLAAGWMIEQCGWKGFREGDAGCHVNQALVLVNYGHATGQEILSLADSIADSVDSRFGVRLEKEVNVI